MSPAHIYRLAMANLAKLEQPRYIVQTDSWKETRTRGNDILGSRTWYERRVWDSENRRECVLGVPFDPNSPGFVNETYPGFAPDSWLLRRGDHRPTEQKGPAPNFEPDLSDVKVIAVESVEAKPFYHIVLVAVDTTSKGGTAYHLKLQPLENPEKHNLRELWINTVTYNIMTAVIEGSYHPAPGTFARHTFVQEDFGSVGRYWLMLHSVWTYPWQGLTASVSQYEVDVVSMQFPDELPDWLFSETGFTKHIKDIPAVLNWADPLPSK